MYHHLYMEQNGPVLYQFAYDNLLGNEVPTCLYGLDSGVEFTQLMFKYGVCDTLSKYIVCETEPFDVRHKVFPLGVFSLAERDEPDASDNKDVSLSQNNPGTIQRSFIWSLQTVKCPLGHHTFNYLRCDELSHCFTAGN